MTDKAVVGNSKKAHQFLKDFRQNGYINLVAIDPVNEAVTAITRPVNEADIYEFIQGNNGKRNLYFTVNTPKSSAPDVKLKKHHIKEINAVWLDADPEKGKDFDEERKRLGSFAKQLMSGTNPPSCVTDSGGGIQAFWILDKPIKANDNTVKEAEALSRGLADQYSTDNVHNIDRIMRLPHTVNIPTKRKADRKPALAKTKLTTKRYSPKSLIKFISPSEAADTEQDFGDVKLDMDYVMNKVDHDLIEKFAKLRKTNQKVDDLWTNTINLKPSRSDRDFTLAKELKMSGFTLEEAAKVLWRFPHGKVQSVNNPEREIIRNYMRSGNDFADDLPQEYIDAIENQTNPITAEREKSTISKGDLPKRLVAIDGGMDDGKVSGKPLLRGLIDMNTVTVIYGASNVGKSFVATDIAAHIAAGKDWGSYKLAKQMGVIYVCAEAGGSYGKRLVATKKRLGIEHGTPIKKWPFQYIKMGVNFLSEMQDIKDVVLLARRQEELTGIPVGMIVIDTLATTFSGGNENSSEDMGKYIENMKWLQEHAHCTVVIVHHSGKDQAAGARGHSSLRAATDTELEVTSDKKGEKYHRQIKTRKQRDGESDTAIDFGLNVVDLWNDQFGDPVTTCHVVLEDDNEFEDTAPSLLDGMERRERALLQAIHLYDKYIVKPDIEVKRFTRNQILSLLMNDILEANEVLVIKDATGMLHQPMFDVSQLPVMADPDKTANTRMQRSWKTIVDSEFPYISERYQLTNKGMEYVSNV